VRMFHCLPREGGRSNCQARPDRSDQSDRLPLAARNYVQRLFSLREIFEMSPRL
jgi:hypothetical protein